MDRPTNGSMAEFFQDPTKVQDLSLEAILPLLIRVGAVQNALAARLMVLVSADLGAKAAHPEDRLLTVAEASKTLGITTDFLYRKAKQLPFTVRVGPQQVRFSARGIQKFIRQRQGV